MPIVAGFVLFFATLAITLTSPPVSAYGADGIVKITVTIAPADSTPSIIVKVKRASNSAVADNEITLTRTSASTFTGDLNNGHLSCSPANSREILLGATVYNNSGGGVTSQILTTLGTSPLVSVCGDPTEKSFSVDIQPVTTNPGATTGTVCGTLSYYNPDTSQVVPYVTDNSNIAVVPSGATNGKTAKTDNNGKYCIGNLTPGTFKLVATYTSPQGKSLDSWTSGDFQITAGQTTTIDHAATPPGGGTSTTGATADVETCNIAGVGWIVCPVSSFIGMITDGVYAAVEQLLYFQIAPDPWNTDPKFNPAYTIWSNIRNIANITFVIAFFIVIFSQATSFGISAYGIRKMLPRIIFAAIMVNLSYYICVLGVDISNIVGAGADGVLKGALNSVGATNQTGLGLSPLIASALLAGGAVWGGAVAVGALAGTLGPAMLGMAITFGIAALMAILVALVVLLGRQALLIILIILSPLAFVAYILPNTESLFTKWRKAFTTMLVFYPLVTVLFAGSQVAAAVMRLASDNAFIDILSIGVQAFPLFATPFLLKFSGGVLGRVAGMVNNPSKGPFDRLRKRGEARTERARNNGQARALANFQGRSKRNPGRAAWWQRGGGGAAARTAESEWQDNQAKSNLQSKRQGYIGNTLSNIGSGLAQQGAGGRHATEEDIAKAVAAGMEAVSELEAKNLKAGKVVISQLDLNENQKAELANTGRTTDRDGREVRGELYRAAQISSYAEEGQIGRLDTALQSLGTASDSTKRYTIDALGKSYSTLKQKGHYLNDEEIKETIRSGGTVTRNILIDAAGRASPDLSPQLLSTQDQQAMERTVEAYHTSMSLEGKAKVRAAAKAVKKNGNLQANLVQGDGRSRDIIENYLI